jgi:hypothetical protein
MHKKIGVELLLASWNELAKSCISAGWDFDEPVEARKRNLIRLRTNSRFVLETRWMPRRIWSWSTNNQSIKRQ